MNLGPKLKARLQVVYFVSASIPLTARLGCRHPGQRNNNSIFNLPGLHQEPPGSSRWLSHSSDCLHLDTHLKMNGTAHRKRENEERHQYFTFMWFRDSQSASCSCLPLILPFDEWDIHLWSHCTEQQSRSWKYKGRNLFPLVQLVQNMGFEGGCPGWNPGFITKELCDPGKLLNLSLPLFSHL